MITVSKGNIKSVINALKGVVPANYNSMDRIVSVVNYLQALLESEEELKEKGTDDG